MNEHVVDNPLDIIHRVFAPPHQTRPPKPSRRTPFLRTMDRVPTHKSPQASWRRHPPEGRAQERARPSPTAPACSPHTVGNRPTTWRIEANASRATPIPLDARASSAVQHRRNRESMLMRLPPNPNHTFCQVPANDGQVPAKCRPSARNSGQVPANALPWPLCRPSPARRTCGRATWH